MSRGFIKKVSKNKYRIRLYLGEDANGKQLYYDKTLEGNMSTAEAHLTEKKAELLQTGSVLKPSDLLLKDYLKQWQETSLKGRVDDKTYESYVYQLEHYIVPELGNRPICQITPMVIQKHYRTMQVDQELSPRTIRYTHSVLSNALKQAVKWRMLPKNPCDDVDLPKKNSQEMKAMSSEEVKSFIKTAKNHRLKVLFELMIATGLRPGEAYALQWADIDLEKGTLSVRRTLSRNSKKEFVFKDPKTKKSKRSMRLPKGLIKSLKHHKRKQAEEILKANPEIYSTSDLVFTARNGMPLDHSNVVNQVYKPMLEKAGLEAYRLYDLRHTCATLMIKANIHVKVVSERLGHASAMMTLDTYSHCLPDMQDEATSKLNDLLYDQVDANSN